MTNNYTHPLLRVFSGIIDLSFTMFISLLIISVYLPAIIFVFIFVPILNSLLIHFLGGSLGALVCGSQIIDASGNKLSFGKAYFRIYAGINFVGSLWIFIDKKHQAWQDKFVDCYVVQKSYWGIITGLISLIVLSAGNLFLVAKIISSLQF